MIIHKRLQKASFHIFVEKCSNLSILTSMFWRTQFGNLIDNILWIYCFAMSNEESSVEESVALARDINPETGISPDALRKERQRLVIQATPYTSQIRKPKGLTDDQFAGTIKMPLSKFRPTKQNIFKKDKESWEQTIYNLRL